MDQRTRWEREIDALNDSKRGVRRVPMGSPGSAQVTRCRLLSEYRNLHARTIGSTLYLALEASDLPVPPMNASA